MLRHGLAPETAEWLIARGGKVEGKYILLPQVCQHLIFNADINGEIKSREGKVITGVRLESITLRQTFACDIHNLPEYPKLCRQYHGHGGRFYKPPGCGYLKE